MRLNRIICTVFLLLPAVGPECGNGSGSTDVTKDAGDQFQPVADLGREEATTEDAPPEVVPAPTEPVYEKGLIVPPGTIPCHTREGVDTNACNHHGSSVEVLNNGTVVAAWYHGLAEKSKDSRILWSSLDPGGTWSEPEVLFDDPGYAEGNPVIWANDLTGELVLFFVTILGESWNDAQIRMISSIDNGSTWSDVKVLREEWHWMTRNHPLRLQNGELLLPCYDEFLYAPSFMYSGDDFASEWEESEQDAVFLFDHMAMIQPTVIQRNDGALFAMMRNTGNGPKTARTMTSGDQGRTWSAPEWSDVPNDNNSIEMESLVGGRVMVVFNNSRTGRFPLGAALSEDEGATWVAVGHLNDECEGGSGCSYSYPSLARDPTDRSVWVTYTHNRDTIGWVHVNEPWLLQQDEVFAAE